MEPARSEPPQYCDIVMKGGITSGVVYPLAAYELAEKYRFEFRNVGGTSAGAIAAAAVAAAERGRRSQSNPNAYQRIAALPAELGEKLITLFQPSPRMKPLFDVLLACVGGGAAAKIAAPLRAFRTQALLGLVPGLVLLVLAFAFHGSWPLHVIAIAFALLIALLGSALAVAREAAHLVSELPGNYFGLCTGNDRDGDATNPPLTRWLARLIDELAGKGEEGPLTFGELWRLGAPPEQSRSHCPPDQRDVNLQMMTTNLSQGRPYSLPFEAGEEFWFDAEELRDLFPREVVDHMIERSPSTIGGVDGTQLHALPQAWDLPVVFAARLSLSFPGLICAVPLYALNDAPKQPSGRPERCWFSDGGIASNFPVHFFDAPIPRWPTFAIDLMPLTPDRSLAKDQCDNVWLPETNEEGIAEAWVGWEHKPSFKQLTAFAGSIFRTAQNWIDNRQMRGAGYRDRIAHVRLSADEGGMNLEMDLKTIKLLAKRGACAADRLAQRLGSAPPDGTQLTWRNQRWLRYRAYMELLERKGQEAARGYGGPADAPVPEPNAGQSGLPWATAEQTTFAAAATAAQLALFEEWTTRSEGFGAGAPEPRAEPWSIPRV
jgi:predicted acylesterase/phospholipase RssA